MTREWYRLVRSNPPNLRDFMSNKALGKTLRNERDREIHDGLSVHQTLRQSRNQAQAFRGNPFVGIAILEIPEGSGMPWKRTGQSEGHHTLWAEPEDLIRYVREVVELPDSKD